MIKGKQEKTADTGDSSGTRIKNFIQITTVLISALTFYFGISQFFYTQNAIDKRKYYTAFYDERYRVLKEVTKSISEITTTMYVQDSLSIGERNEIYGKLVIFNYSHLILNQNNLNDSLVLEYINEYESKMVKLLDEDATLSPSDLDLTGRLAIAQCGKILNDEKENINSFNFKFFPF